MPKPWSIFMNKNWGYVYLEPEKKIFNNIGKMFIPSLFRSVKLKCHYCMTGLVKTLGGQGEYFVEFLILPHTIHSYSSKHTSGR